MNHCGLLQRCGETKLFDQISGGRIKRLKKKKSKNGSSRSTSSASSRISTKNLELIVDRLKGECHRNTTRKMYHKVWKQFALFYQRLDRCPPTWEERIVLFIGYLIQENKQSSTIRSYLSAIRAVLKTEGVKLNKDLFLINSLTRACKLKNDKIKVRLPIDRAILEKILTQTKKHFENEQNNQPYLSLLYRTIFATAYFGMFRIGELTSGDHAVLAKDVSVGQNKKKMLFTLHSSKTHGKGNLPQSVKITSTSTLPKHKVKKEKPSSKAHCPYHLLKMFGKLRGPYWKKQCEPFFVFADRSPVQPHHARNCLKTVLKKAGYDETQFSFHSFRIGCSNTLLKLGLSVETIKKLGRWRSNAVFKYLR